MRLAPEGKPIWASLGGLWIAALATAVIFTGLLPTLIAVVVSGLFLFTLWFFRDPARNIPGAAGVIVAPADGKVIEISDLPPDDDRPAGTRKISIFMSPLNVHINRVPIGGRIELLRYNRGKFLTAFHEKASLLNEQQFIRIKVNDTVVDFVQIAGWLARRIVCHLHEGQEVQTGERFGLIRFGSRVDIYLPDNCGLSVAVNQRVRAGETIVGVMHEAE